jgi:predicted nucleic acid-binding protein
MILVDSNIWIDLIQRDSVWFDWSLEQTQRARAAKLAVINPVIYAELAATYDTAQELATFIRASKVGVKPLSQDCAYLAGRAFLDYRKRKGAKSGVLPDFFIGAQAQTEGWKILTRDAARYNTYFPSVRLICP